MPLQKLPPQGTLANDAHVSKRRQMQERRRTLQTISELSTTDGTSPDFSTFIAAKRHAVSSLAERKSQNFSKRQSLPQYCLSPACAQSQVATTVPILRSSMSQHSLHNQTTSAASSSRYEAGWNARRERARAQREQAVGGTRHPQGSSGYGLLIGSHLQLSTTAPKLSSRPSQNNLRSHANQQQLLRNSCSIGGSSQTSNIRSSLRNGRREHDTESSGRTSTDSSSHHSSYDSAIRRSRSGSSSDRSFTSSQTTPPMPIASPPPIQRYYTMPATQIQYTPARGQSKSLKYVRPESGYRTSSLPAIRIEHPSAMAYDNKRSTPRIASLPAHQKQQVDIQRARLESLAALTASQGGVYAPTATPSGARSRPTSTQSRRSSAHSTQNNRHSSNQSRPHSQSSLKVPSRPRPMKHMSSSIIYDQNPDKISLHPEHVAHERKFVPKRESLTQWKAEREAARAKGEGIQRAKTIERVRRANELELEREKELMEMGKSIVLDEKETVKWTKERESGCFGGLLAAFGIK